MSLIPCYVEMFIISCQKASLHDYVETLLMCVTKVCLKRLFHVVKVDVASALMAPGTGRRHRRLTEESERREWK